jgi:hypothetical protein
MVAARLLACRDIVASDRFSPYDKAAEVKPYVYGIGGIAHVLKELGITGAAQFSPNLTAFAPSASARSYGRNRSERRQIRRVKEREKLAGRSAPDRFLLNNTGGLLRNACAEKAGPVNLKTGSHLKSRSLPIDFDKFGG